MMSVLLPSLLAAIVLPENPTLNESFAAGEFRYWHKELTGKAEPSYDVCIGRSFGEKLFPDDIKFLEGSEGFAVREKDGKLYLFGAKPCGNCFAVYDFLEKNTDIVWPSHAKGVDRIFTPVDEVPLRVVDYREKPTFAQRLLSINNGLYYNDPRTEHFALRTKVNAAIGSAARRKAFGFSENDGATHNFWKYLRWEDYKDTHPEYFGLINGERKRPGFEAQLCYTAPGCPEELARNFVRERLDNGMPCEYAGLGIDDQNFLCQCEGCKAPIALPDGRILRREDDKELFDTTRYWLWYNKVAREIRRLRPEFKVMALAYMQATRPPPIDIEDNVIVGYVPSGENMKQDFLGPVNKRAWDWMCQWDRRCERWSNWHWWGCAAAYPRPAHVTTKSNLELFSKTKLWRFHTEWIMKDGAEYVSAIEYWILAKLLWNVRVDVNALREEYLTKVFRGAADEMRRFYDIVRDTWYADGAPSFCYDSPARLTGYYLLQNPEVEKAAFTALSNAVRKADHPVSKLMSEKILETMSANAEKARKTLVLTGAAECPVVRGADFKSMFGAWDKAQVFPFSAFRNTWFPKKGIKQPIEVHMASDGETLSFKCRTMRDPRGDKRCERLFSEDHWEIFIQPGRNDPTVPYYLIAADWRGRRWTSIAYEEAPDALMWNVETAFGGSTWDALFTIPMKQLKLTNDVRFFLYHWDPVNREHESLKGTGNIHDAAGFMKLTFVEGK